MARSAGTPSTVDPTHAVIVTLVGLLVGVGLLLWVTGQVAGRIFGGAWPDIAPTDMAGILIALKDHAADPALAWPPAARRLLPGPAGFYATLAALGAATLGGVWWVAGLRARLTGSRRRARPADGEAAAWATPRQLAPLRVAAPQPGRITLGRAGRHLLAAEPNQAVIVLGPARSGKTTGLAIPAILEWDGPVIATSVRDDLVAATIHPRRARGQVWVYDPTGHAADAPPAGWDPLGGCRTWTGALRTASWLADAGRDGHLADGDFWHANAAKLLAPLLYAAATTDRTIDDVLRWIDLQDQQEPLLALEAAGELSALTAAHASFGREERTRSSVYTTAETLLRAFADPDVAASTYTPDITPDRLLDGHANTLYICAPSHELVSPAVFGQSISSLFLLLSGGLLAVQVLVVDFLWGLVAER